ncbi:uncharacterized protein LOC120899812 [Anopheles arabiensis]|uniref:uncharacterized protein LOC120899812 n=1 Tax=Anopheles arabiensis TaxID=7173 RepID=UPI001AAC52C5|nr:uncharacterized protein LOC120899812 [Anopheles arabiensis]
MVVFYSLLLFAACSSVASSSPSESCVVENELTSNPSTCNQYYRCLSGERILFSCTEGKVFNPSTKRCVTSDLYPCDETQPENTTAEPSLLCLHNPNGIVPHPSDCDKYIVCSGGLQTVQSCGYRENFSWKKLGCGEDVSCSEYFNGYARTLESVACNRQSLPLAEHPYEVGTYIDCGAQESVSCAEDTIFRWNYQRCLPGLVATNELQSAAPNCGAFGKSAHPYLCEKYFKCVFWISSLENCPADMIYSAVGNECVPGNFQTCTVNQ